jgi:DNA-binding response OmpR family regulator
MAVQQKVVVVVIEDDHYVLESMRLMLEQQGYEVHPAADGEQGLALIQKHVPGLVILDLMLPKVDGFTILKKMLADPKTAEVPVVVVSAYSTSESTRRMVRTQKNVREVFSKPFLPRDLVVRLKEILNVN